MDRPRTGANSGPVTRLTIWASFRCADGTLRLFQTDSCIPADMPEDRSIYFQQLTYLFSVS